MPEGVRIIGLRELDASLRELRKDVLKELRPKLREAGDLVRAEGASLFSRISTKSAAGYKVRVRQRGVAVEQSLGRVTGKRGDYGALQMRLALVPALESQQGRVGKLIEDMVGEQIDNSGLG